MSAKEAVSKPARGFRGVKPSEPMHDAMYDTKYNDQQTSMLDVTICHSAGGGEMHFYIIFWHVIAFYNV